MYVYARIQGQDVEPLIGNSQVWCLRLLTQAVSLPLNPIAFVKSHLSVPQLTLKREVLGGGGI